MGKLGECHTKLTRTQNVDKLPIFSTKVASSKKKVAYEGDVMLSTSVLKLFYITISLLIVGN